VSLAHLIRDGTIFRDGTIEAGTGRGYKLSRQVLEFTDALLADLPGKGGCRGGTDDDN
jgi:hypothetical protein